MYLSVAVTIVASLLDLCLGIIVLHSNRKNIVNQTFSIFSIIVGLWISAALLLKLFPSYITGSITVSIGVCIGIAFFLFARVYPSSQKRPSVKFYLPLIILLVFLVVGYFTRLVLRDVKIVEGTAFPEFGLLYIPLIIYVSLPLIYSIYKLIVTFKRSRAGEKLRMVYLVIAMSGFVLTTFIMNGLLPTLGVYTLVDVGPSASVLWMFVIFLAVSRQRLFGVKQIMGRFAYLVIKAVVYIFSFYLIYILLNKIWGGLFTSGAIFTGVVIASAYVFIFDWFDKLLLKFLERVLIYADYNPYLVIDNLLKDTSTELDISKVTAKIIFTIKQVFDVNNVGMVIFDRKSKKFLYRKFSSFDKHKFNKFQNLIDVVSLWEFQENKGDKAEILIYDEVMMQLQNRNSQERSKLKSILGFMKEKDVAIVLPLNRKVQLNGLILIGYKNDEKAYTVQDIGLLESIIANASVAVGRSLLYQQVESFAEDLEEKVEESTKELEKRANLLDKKNNALELASKRERDMMDIVGHELRTPATVVKNALAYIETLKRMKKLSKKKLAEYINRAQNAIEREIKLINTFLGAAKFEGGQMQFDPHQFSIVELVKQVVRENKLSAKDKGLKLIYKKGRKNIPQIDADRTRIGEVIDNLISNAIKYTIKGQITVWMDTDKEKETVSVYIKDTGRGISKEDQEKLFSKFGRVKNHVSEKERMARIVRPGGTGLGLYVSKGIVKLHGGDIFVESTLGKGSLFYFTIPVKHKIPKKNLINPIFSSEGEKDIFAKLKMQKKK